MWRQNMGCIDGNSCWILVFSKARHAESRRPEADPSKVVTTSTWLQGRAGKTWVGGCPVGPSKHTRDDGELGGWFHLGSVTGVWTVWEPPGPMHWQHSPHFHP